jgi:hypothetical protein
MLSISGDTESTHSDPVSDDGQCPPSAVSVWRVVYARGFTNMIKRRVVHVCFALLQSEIMMQQSSFY